MIYNFDEVIERKNTNSEKWDFNDKVFGDKDILPMWVADMDFRVPSPVIEAIKNRAEHGIYGYTGRTGSYYDAIIGWMKKRHSFDIKKEWIVHTPGVVPSLNLAVLAFTKPGDKIIIQSPVYHPFFSAIKENERKLVDNQLKLEAGRYVMDYENLQNKIDPDVKMIIISNPHNPVGRVWKRDELEKLGKICLENNIIIISDEIHSDLIYKGHKHIPMASISKELAQNTVTCIAPSKTFNIAGLQTSSVIISDPELRTLYKDIILKIGIDMGNVFGIAALEAAYNYGEEWLEQLLEYLQANIEFMVKYFEENIPSINIVKPEGTYLVWVDFSGLNMDKDSLKEFMIKKAKVGFNDGIMFGSKGEGYQRINVACPRSILKDGLDRIKEALVDIGYF